jgi:hypothetical protein
MAAMSIALALDRFYWGDGDRVTRNGDPVSVS